MQKNDFGKMKTKKITAQFFLLFFSYTNTHPNILREKPKTISSQEIEALAKDWSTIFTWKLPYKTDFVCFYAQKEAGFALRWLSIPWYIKNYQVLTNAKNQLYKNDTFRKKYYFDKPLKYENTIPQQIDLETCATLLKNNRFIFYTGAGISAGSVATMNSLMQTLQMNNGAMQFLKNVICNSNQITQSFNNFCESCAYATPTDAHHAVKEIAQRKSVAILTENVDLLHQRTGIIPIFTSFCEVDSITPENIAEIDFIVCIGLSHDDRGLLAHFKNNNPNIYNT